MKPKQEEREALWLTKGYVSVRVAAEKTRRGIDTVYRSIKSGDLEVKMDGTQRFVSIRSLIKWLGTDTAKLYGLVK